MTIGGRDKFGFFNTVELYSWKNGSSCLADPLPMVMIWSLKFGKIFAFDGSFFFIKNVAAFQGTLMNGNPVVCGGYNGTIKAECYKFKKETKQWKRVFY